MRLRIIILVLAILALLSASAGGGLYYYSLRQTAFQQEENNAYRRLELLNRQLTALLAEHINPVKALSGLKELKSSPGLIHPGISQNAIAKNSTQIASNINELISLNSILDNFANSLDLEACYLMDNAGTTVASSNRDKPDSFVGKNFAFRPYFMEAAAGKPSTYIAVGTTSRKRGIYYSHPVYSYSYDYDKEGYKNGKIIGVAVMKASVEQIESKLFSEPEGILLVTDPNGVIFIANRQEFKFMLLWKLDRQQIQKINDSRQFGHISWVWTGFSPLNDRYLLDKNREKYLYSQISLDGYRGWKIVHLKRFREISRQLADPFIKVIGQVVLIILMFIGISVFILYRKAIQEILRRKKAEKELKINEERYRNIYHKTPVMLHSIDTQGNIIGVSDFWLEKMGYAREEVIGKKLTDFYSNDSKRYAEDVIFPYFFETGFCKDVPYTYIKKDGGKIEILLSCYGVRNEYGSVVRSLAVSVDVTEKNQVQHDLELARELLARHSLDLEQQVEERTEELKKVQNQLRKLSGNIMAAHENERRAVARELHDHLGQILTALKMDGVWLEKYLEPIDHNAAKRAGRICSLIDDTISDVRAMAFRLRPGLLDDLGLVDALEFLTRDFEKRSEVWFLFRHTDIPDIDDTVATALYRIVQEAITNAMKHAKATEISIDLSVDDNSYLVLTVEDNGCGFSSVGNKEYHGLGLTGMKERATLSGGTLEIFSAINQGTRITCHLDLNARGNDSATSAHENQYLFLKSKEIAMREHNND
ncbi:MAG: PAS domain S-box protein [Desulfamplus sp.]|nr:PAS domain S-box protein [Desulfamplus sp.]